MTRKHRTPALSSRSKTVGWLAATCKPLFKVKSPPLRLWQETHFVGKTCRSCYPLEGFFFNYSLDKNRIKALISWSLMHFGERVALNVAEKVKEVGFEYATQAGASLGLEDLKIPPTKVTLVSQAELDIQLTQASHLQGNLTALERFQHLIDTWHRSSENLKKDVVRYFRSTDLLNPVYMMAFSGARGNISQVGQLVGMRGLMADPKGQIISFPIRSNFREGLTLTEYVISCYGARKGLVDTALRTANAGYLTRRLVDVSHHVVVSQFDCKTNRGIVLRSLLENGKDRLPLQSRLTGRVLARDLCIGEGLPSRTDPFPAEFQEEFYRGGFASPEDLVRPSSNVSSGNGANLGLQATRRINPALSWQRILYELTHYDRPGKMWIKREVVGSRNQQISYGLAEKIAALWDKVLVRSPLSCNRLNSICQLCYGWSLAEGQLVSLGEAVGVIAAQSIGEPGTQLTMRTFHTGGVFSGDVVDEIKAPHDGWVEFAAPLQGKLIRTSHGKIAFRTKVRSRLVVSTVQPFLGNKVKAAEGSGFKIPPLTVLFVRQGEYVADNQLVAEVPIEDTRVDDKVLEPFYYSSELEGKVLFENLRLNLALGEKNTKTSTSGRLGSVWVLSGQVPAALDFSFLTDGDFIDQRSVLSRESGWLSWGGVVSNLSPLVQNKTRYQGKESREGLLTEGSQNPLCQPYQPLISKRMARFQVVQKGGREGCFATNLPTRLAGQGQRGKRLLSELGNDNIDINQPFLSLPWADIQYKKVGYLLSHPTNRRSHFLCPQPWLTQHASQPLAARETCVLQPPSRPKSSGSAPGTTRHDCFFVSSSLSKVFKTAFEGRTSFKLYWFPIQYRTETGSLTRNSGLYLFKGLSRGQLLWTVEEGYRVRLMRYNRGKQTDLVLHAKRKSKQNQNYRQLYTASLLWALARCRRGFSHLATLASKKESVSASAKHRLLKQPNTRLARTRALNSGVLPRTRQLGKKVGRYTKPLSPAPAAKGRNVTGKPFNRKDWFAFVLQAKQGTKRLQGSPLIGTVGANVVGLQPCGIQLKWVERGFVLGLQNNLQGNQVLLTAPFNGWLAVPSLLQPLPSGCKARKPGKTKPHTTFKGGKNLLKGCIEKSVDRSYRARIQTLSPLLLNKVRELVKRKQDRNRLVGLNLALARNRACSLSGVCTFGPDKSASPKARNHLFYNRPRTANTIRCQTGFAFNQLVEAWPWPVMVTRGSCAETSLKKHKPGLGAALHAKKPLLLSLLRPRSHKYRSLIQNPCPPLKLLGGGLVFLEAHVDRCFDHSLANLYSKKLFLWDVKQNPAHKLRFWAVDCGKVFDSRKAEWERKGWSLNRIKLSNYFSYTSLKGRNVWHDCLVSEQKPFPFLAREKRRPCPRRGLLLLGVTSNMPSTGLACAMRDQAATQLKMKPGLIFFSRTQTNQAGLLPPLCGGSRAQAALLHQSFLPPGLAISNCYFQAYKEKVVSLEGGSGVTSGKGQMQATSKSKAQAERVVSLEKRNKNRLVAKEGFALCGVLLQRSNNLASQLVGLVNSLPPGKPARGVWRLTGHESLSFNSTFVSTGSVRTFPFYPTRTLKSWLQDTLCSRVSLKESKTSLPAATRTNTANPLPTRQQVQQAGNRVRGCDNLHKTLHLSSKLGLINSTDQHAAKNQGTILLLKQDLCSNQPRSGAGFTLKQTTKINTGWQPWQCKANATVFGQNSQSNSFLLFLRLVFSGVRANPPCFPKFQKRFLFDLYRGFAFNEFLPLFLVLGNNNSCWTIDYKNHRPAAACTHTNPLEHRFRYQEWCGLIGRRKASHQPLPGADPPPTKQVVSTNQGVQVTRVKPFERGLPGFSLKQTTHKTPAPSNANRFQGQERKHLHVHRTGGTGVSVAGGATGNLQSWLDLQSNMSLHPLGLKLLATVLSLVGKGPNLEGKKQFNKGFSFLYPNNSHFGFRQLATAKNGAGHELDHLANQNLDLLACKVQSCSVLANSQHKRVIYESATCSGSAGTHSVRQGASPRPKGRETGLEFSKFNHKSNKQWPDKIEIAGPKLLNVKLNPIIRFKGGRKPMRVSVAKDWLDEFYWKVDLNFTPASIYLVASILVVSVVLVTITRLRYQGVDLNLTRLGVKHCKRIQTAKDKQTGVLNPRETSFIRLFVRFQTPATYFSTLIKSHILPISPLPHRQGLCWAFYANPYRLSMLNDRTNRLTIDQALSFAISCQNRFVCDLVGEEMLSGKPVLCNKHLHTPASFAPSIACFSTSALHCFKANRRDNSHARAMSQACCAYLAHQNGGLARNKVSDTLSRRVNPLAFGKCFHLTFSKRGPQPVKLGKQTKVVRRKNRVLTHRNGWTSSVLTCNFGPYAGEVTSSLNGFGCLVLTSNDQTSFSLLGKPLKPGYPHRETNVNVGQLIRYGQEVSPENRAAVSTSGQVLQITGNTLTVRKAHPTRIPTRSLLCAEQGRFIKKQENLLVMWYEKLTTGDIVQGIPKIEQLFEARQTKAGVRISNNLSDKLALFFDSYQNPDPVNDWFPVKSFTGLYPFTTTGQRRADQRFNVWYEPLLMAWDWQLSGFKGASPSLAARQGVKRVQLLLVERIQRVYLSQGVVISDKHLEIVARQMTSKARIVEGGSHGLVHDELVDLNLVERYNSFLFQSETVSYEPTVLGITKTSLESRSSLSAASFQETTRVLRKAGIQPKLDLLGGLKQRVIIGDLIGAGTGFVGFKKRKRKGHKTLPEHEKGSESRRDPGPKSEPSTN